MFFLYISAHLKTYLNCCHCTLALILEFDQGRPSDYLLNKFSVVGIFPRFHFHFYNHYFILKGIMEMKCFRNIKHKEDFVTCEWNMDI